MRIRLLLLVTGAGALLAGLPCAALTSPTPEGTGGSASATAEQAFGLLQSAARAARVRTWSGTQHVVSVRDGQPTFTVLQVSHIPGAGSSVHVVSPEQDPVGAVVADVLDSKLLSLLAGHYDLAVVGPARWQRHAAVLVEARRPGGQVAGRFWVDAATHLVLRREVLDTTGSVIRSSAFVELQLGSPAVRRVAVHEAVRPTGHALDADALRAMEDEGWPVVYMLPGGLELFEARLHDSNGVEVLQLTYSDGLSTLSLFAQEGELAVEPPGTARSVGGGTVWVGKGSPERVVWSGGGRTWTLVSDAPEQTVSDAVLVLPHTASVAEADGIGARVWRGMSRAGGWLNPFD